MDEYGEIVKNLMTSFQRFKRVLKGPPSSMEGLRPSELELLFQIRKIAGDRDGVKVSELSSGMHVTSPSITQIVTGLEEQGLVARAMDMSDRRAVQVSLTPKGKDLVDGAHEHFSNKLMGIVQHLGPEKSRELISIIDDIMIYLSNEKS